MGWVSAILGLAGAGYSYAGSRSAAKGAKSAAGTALEQRERAAAEEKRRREEALRMKQEAAKRIKMPTLLETETAPLLRKTLEERIAGRGLIDVGKLTAPFATQRRAGLREQEIPAISAAASARGVGRSTIPVNRIALATQTAERDIEERIAQLQLTRETQKGQAIGRYLELTEQEALSQREKAKFELAEEFDIADTIAGNAEIEKRNQFAIADSIQQKGTTAAAYELQQATIIGSALIAAGMSWEKTQKKSNQDIIDAINKEQANRGLAAQVEIAGTQSATQRAGGLFQ